jgi:hypothetical protein
MAKRRRLDAVKLSRGEAYLPRRALDDPNHPQRAEK